MFELAPWVLVLIVLFLQPVVWLLWAYLLARLLLTGLIEAVSTKVERRINDVITQANDK